MATTGSNRIGHVAEAVMRARETSETTTLSSMIHVVVNNKEEGHVHRLSEAMLNLPRDRRRTQCGWRAGAAGANARFSSTCVWPPLGCTKSRLCAKCFPRAEPLAVALPDDPIEE